MTAPVPNAEPTTLRAGDTWTWRKSLADYSAAEGWTLRYVLVNAEHRKTFDSSADGSDHLITVDADDTDDTIVGSYVLTCLAINGTERFTIGQSQLEVLPNVAADRPYDLRSAARRIYDALLESYESHKTSGKSLVLSYSIAGRSMTYRNESDLLKDLTYWKAQVQAEEDDAKRKAGLATGNRIYTVLTR